MRIGIISDTHGKQSAMMKALDKMGKIDLLIHLGDLCTDAIYLSRILDFPVEFVKGNCDYSPDISNDKMLDVFGKKIYMTHGHLFQVKLGVDKLYYKAKELCADVVLYGHTHIADVFFEDGILFMNPGSVSDARGSTSNTAGIIHIDREKIIPHIFNT